MDIKEEIEELKNKISELEGEIKEKEKGTNDWKPKNDELYGFVDLDTIYIEEAVWYDNRIDNIRYNHRVIFKTENEAREYLEYLEEKEKHMDTFTDEDWKNYTIKKYFYSYDYYEETIDWNVSDTHRESKPYFKTFEEVKNFIQKYEWQIKHELGVE